MQNTFYSHTVLDSSLPDSIMRRQSGMISVVNRKLITSCSSVFTSAPTKPKTFSSPSFKIVKYVILSLIFLTDNAETCEPQVFEGSGFADRVQERI